MIIITLLKFIFLFAGTIIIFTKILPGTAIKNRFSILLLSAEESVFILFLFTDFPLNSLINIVLTITALIFPVVVIRYIPVIQIIYILFTCCGFSFFIKSFLILILNFCCINTFDEEIINCMASLSILFLVVFKYKSKIFAKLNILILPVYVKFLIAITFWTGGFLASFYSYTPNAKLFFKWYNRIELCIVLIFILILFLIPALIANTNSNKYYQSLSRKTEKQISEQSRYFEQSLKSDIKLKKFRHDYKNLITGLTCILKNNDTNEALKYLNSCSMCSKELSSNILFETGNYIVNTILSEKQRRASKINAKISFEGKIPPDGIEPADLCIIFGNTLDNAVEACLKLPDDIKKNISVTSKTYRDFLYIEINNPVPNNIKINNNSIQTTKNDRSQHGFGLYSLQIAVHKYNGELNLSCENNCFAVRIYLYPDKKSNDG